MYLQHIHIFRVLHTYEDYVPTNTIVWLAADFTCFFLIGSHILYIYLVTGVLYTSSNLFIVVSVC